MMQNEVESARRPAALIIGATGLLGPYLCRSVRQAGIRPIGMSRRGPDVELDLLDDQGVQRWLSENRPEYLIYAAALTDVDRCEREPDLADALHRRAVESVLSALRPEQTFVYISTDQVYPDTPGLHREDEVGPVNVYGDSKLAGEHAALQRERALILRTNLFGPSLTPGRNSLSDFMVERLRQQQDLSLFKDALFSPLHLQTLADLSVELAVNGARGVFNLGCRDGMSKMDFGYALARHFDLPTDNVSEVISSNLPGRVRRIKDMRMDVSRVENQLDRMMPTLLQEVAKL